MKKSIIKVNPKAKTQKRKPTMLLLWPQFILTIAVIVLAIVTLFMPSLFKYLGLLLGITLIDMGINNAFIYKRQHVTLVYLGVGLVILVIFILQFVRG